MATFRQAMEESKWTALADMPLVAKAFSNCGNWGKAEIGSTEALGFMQRVGLPCIGEYMESFPNIKGRHVNFNYYSYKAGDCLSTHDDTDDAYSHSQGHRPPTRRLALVTYFHQEWQPDWGGELMLYEEKKDQQGNRTLEVSDCVAPHSRLPGHLHRSTIPPCMSSGSLSGRPPAPLHCRMVYDRTLTYRFHDFPHPRSSRSL